MAEGARSNVVRAVFDEPYEPETAACPLCGSTLAFTTAEGQALEACPNRTCPNHRPHRPTPDLSMSKPTKKRRPRPY